MSCSRHLNFMTLFGKQAYAPDKGGLYPGGRAEPDSAKDQH